MQTAEGDKIRLEMAIAKIHPVTDQRVVTTTFRQRLVARKQGNNSLQQVVEHGSMLAFELALVIAFEPAGPFNPPH